jgi:hypothetical protein
MRADRRSHPHCWIVPLTYPESVMAVCTPWKRWFAWRSVRIDGKLRWWRYIERRRVTVSLELSAFAEPDTTSFWQYRNYCPVDHQSEEMVQELLDWVVLLTGLGCMIWIGLQVV